MKTKIELRAYFKELLVKQLPQERERKSQIITQALMQDRAYQEGKMMMFYASMIHEVDTFGLIRKAIADGKQVCLPIVEKSQKRLLPIIVDHVDQLKPSHYGIYEPPYDATREADVSKLSLILVPGLAFDQAGHRLGYGVGYYDRFLASVPASVKTIGLAFDFQLTDCLPVDAHDQAVNRVLFA